MKGEKRGEKDRKVRRKRKRRSSVLTWENYHRRKAASKLSVTTECVSGKKRNQWIMVIWSMTVYSFANGLCPCEHLTLSDTNNT